MLFMGITKKDGHPTILFDNVLVQFLLKYAVTQSTLTCEGDAE